MSRVDSFEFVLVLRNTKLYETGHCFAEFRLFRETEKIRKYEKKCFVLFRQIEKNVSFRSFAYFKLNFLPTLRISNLLFEFRTLYSNSSCVPFFEFHSFLSHQ